MSPIVSALVPVHKGESTIRSALESLFRQDVSGLEVLVLDDGSPDRSGDVAAEVASQFPHVPCRVVRHDNVGIASTLNRGLSLARGHYIARLDADDIALPGRLRRQLEYLEANPSIAVVGTSAAVWRGERASGRKLVNPLSHDAIALTMLFSNPLVHSSILARTSALKAVGGYRDVGPAQDYEIWSRIHRSFRMANLPDVLTVYRETPGGVSRRQNAESITNAIWFASDNLHHTLGPEHGQSACQSLARLYYCRRGIRSCPRMSPSKVKSMLDLGARRIAGAPQNWSTEFRGVYWRLAFRLLAKCGLSWLPPRSCDAPNE